MLYKHVGAMSKDYTDSLLAIHQKMQSLTIQRKKTMLR